MQWASRRILARKGADTVKRLAVFLSSVVIGCQFGPLAPVSDHSIATALKEGRSRLPSRDPTPARNAIAQSLAEHYSSWRGVRHRYGGVSRSGVDCSGFVLLTYRKVFGIELPRTTREQARLGKRVSQRQLRPGDLVFFKIGWGTKHVGIYLGDGAFMHASESRGVAKSRLKDPYWRNRYWKAKHLL